MPPAEIKNGLLDMESRTRRVPPPRHPKLAVDTPPAPEPPAAPPKPVERPPNAPPAPVGERLRAPAPPALRGAQVYLDTESDDFLSACRAVGEVSNSAVIRYLIGRAAAESMPIEVVRAVLSGDNAAHRKPGRRKTSYK